MKSHVACVTLAFITCIGLPNVISQAPVPKPICCQVHTYLNGVHVHCKNTVPAKHPNKEQCVNSYENLSTFGRIQSLNLSCNDVSVVPNLATSELSRLVSLDLSHNALQVLPRDALRGFTKLESLNLSHNQLAQLTSDSFAQLTSLETLNLSFNQLEVLPVGLFDELGQLLALDLSHNLLGAVLDLHNLFQQLSSLTVLNLSHNALTELPIELFQRLSSLGELDLSKNRLHNVSGGVFQGLGDLVRLDLAHNDLKAVSTSTFKGLEKVEHLDLSHNSLITLRKASFTPLSNLWWLSLRSNRMKWLPEHLFGGLKWLNYLDLSDNQLLLDHEALPPEVFSPLIKLNYLLLDHNDRRTEGRYPKQVFTPLSQLRHLSIDTFSTVEFHQDFAQLAQLRTLELPACKIKSLTSDSFSGLQVSPLLTIRLDGCPLQETRGCPFCGFENLETFSFTNRPSQFVDAHDSPGTPLELLGPENALLRRINMSNVNFRPDSVQYFADHTLKNLDRLEVLDLSNNKLQGVHFSLKVSVKQILLSGNKFQSIPVNLRDLSRLNLLDMKDNGISFLTESERAFLNGLAKSQLFNIRLAGNQFQCPLNDCSTADLYKWFAHTEVNFDEGQVQGRDYACVTEEGRPSSMETARAYCHASSTFAFVYASLLLAFSCAVGVLICVAVQCLGNVRPRRKSLPSGGETRDSVRDSVRDGGADDSRVKHRIHVTPVNGQPTLHLSELDYGQVLEGSLSLSDSSPDYNTQHVTRFSSNGTRTLMPQPNNLDRNGLYIGNEATAAPLLAPNIPSCDDRDSTLTDENTVLGHISRRAPTGNRTAAPNTPSWENRDSALTDEDTVSDNISRKAPPGNRDLADGSSSLGSYNELPGPLGFRADRTSRAARGGADVTRRVSDSLGSPASSAWTPDTSGHDGHHHTAPKQAHVGDGGEDYNITPSDVPGFLTLSPLSSGATSVAGYELHHQTLLKMPVADDVTSGHMSTDSAMSTKKKPSSRFSPSTRTSRSKKARAEDDDDDEKMPLGFQPMMNLAPQKGKLTLKTPVEETGSSR
ncbi:uncharacterized protein [Littorina saxatilis]|uniref:Uncharacterized protein n=1 Tax=Littorina saxatilis TaxID=31220 RepID=A0AAN9GF55_9CAEN